MCQRKSLSKLKSGEEKLELVRKTIALASTVNPRDYSNAFRLYLSQTVDPIMKCLQNHYGDNDDAFISNWALKKFKHGRFGTTVCSGGNTCGMVEPA